MKIIKFLGLTLLLFIVALPLAAKGPPGGETAGNNLSFPVIWAEGITKVLPGTPEMDPVLTGEWWYWWGTEGTDPNVYPLSCSPDPDDQNLCDDGIPGQATGDIPGEGYPPEDLVKAYVQKDPLNIWQAESWPPLGASPTLSVVVDLIDWGDNLESVDWYTRSQVRTEVVLFEDQLAGDVEENPWPMLEYQMRHTSGWGIDEVHGLAATISPTLPLTGTGTTATVYSYCPRLTIQKLMVAREDLNPDDLVWIPEIGWTESVSISTTLINDPIFNLAVYEGGDGPGYYSAEINVKGRIIYGYTWKVNKLHDDTPVPPSTKPTAAGDYRVTFSFDQLCGGVTLNTFFVEGVTEIMQPLEEQVGDEPGVGGHAVLDTANNLTYIDVRILEKGGGGGGGGGGNHNIVPAPNR